MRDWIKARWLEALRGEEFKQATGSLIQAVSTQSDEIYARGSEAYKLAKEPDADFEIQHCCLGVLCELYARETGDRPSWGNGVLPTAVVAWAELESSDPVVIMMWDGKTTDRTHTKLSVINDSHVPFSEIADIIDAQL